MAIRYELLYKQKGTRRLEHFIKCRILDANTFEFPIESELHWWKGTEEVYYLTKDYGYLKKVDKCFVESKVEPNTNLFQGKSMNKSFIFPGYLSDSKKLCNEFRFLKPNQDVATPTRTLKLYNYGPMMGKIKYPTQPLRPYYIFYNSFIQLIDQLNKPSERRSFVVLDMPDNLLSRQDVVKFSRRLYNGAMDRFPSYKDFVFLDIWRFLNPEQRNESALSKLDPKRYDKIDLLLCMDNKIILINFKYLASIVKEYNIETPIKPRTFKLAQRFFYRMIMNLINMPALNDTQLEQLEQNINNDPNIENTYNESNQDSEEEPEENNESPQPEEPKSKDESLLSKAKQLFGRFNTNVTSGAVSKAKESTVQVFNFMKKDRSDDDIYNDDEDEVDYIPKDVEDIIDKQNREIDDIINSVNDTEAPEDAFEVSDNLDEPTELDRKLIDADLEDIDKLVNESLEQIYKEEVRYTNVYDKLDNAVDNKVINKAGAKKLKEESASCLTKKDPVDGDKTLEEILNSIPNIEIEEEFDAITDNIVVFDKSYNKNTIKNIKSSYIKNQYREDIIKCIYGLQNTNLIITNVEYNTDQNLLGTMEEYRITIKTFDKKTHVVNFFIPKIEEDGTFMVSGNRYTMRWQRNSLPIRKISVTEVKLSSYYMTLFVEKATKPKYNVSTYLVKQLSDMYGTDKNLKDLILLTPNNENVKLPLDYAQFSRKIKGFKYKDIIFSFDYYHRHKLIGLESNKDVEKLEKRNMVLVGVKGKLPIFIDFNNRLFIMENNRYEEIENLYETLGLNRASFPIEYTSLRLYKNSIPVALILSFYYGITNLLKILKVNWRFEKDSTRIKNAENTYPIKFKDGCLYIERDNGLGDITLGGLLELSNTLKEVKFSTLDNKNLFLTIFNKLEYSNIYINEIKNLETLYVDPITLSICKELKYPTNFKGMLLKANELLLEDTYTNMNNIKEMNIRGYERIAGMIYHELIRAIKEYEHRSVWSKSKLNVNPYAITTKINEDSTTVLVDDLNPMAAMKQTEDVSYLGEQGMKKEAMAGSSRVFHESEVGVISEATKDSGDVGITAYMSANPKLDTLRGTIGNLDAEKDGLGSIYSTNAMLMPFSLNDDTKRLNFSSIHSSHIIPIKNMRVPYVRTGYEAIVPIKSDDKFVITAEDNGEVLKSTANEISVQYDKLGKKSYRIKSWTSKEESDACYTHVLVPNLKQGDKFIKDDTLVYDSSFFEPDIFNPKRVIYKQGDVITVALLEDSNTYEDSCSISRRVTDKLGTVVTKIKSIVIDKKDNVSNVKFPGTKLEPTTELLTITDEIVNIGSLDKKSLSILKDLKTQSPKAKVRGVVNKIEVRYNCDKNDMSITLKALAEYSDRLLKQKTGFTGDVTKGGYAIKNKPLLEDEVEIKIYINVDTDMGLGDKAIFGNQLKCTVGEVFDDNITAEDGTEIDATFSYKSISARIVNSPMLIGTTSMCLEQLTKAVIKKYFK